MATIANQYMMTFFDGGEPRSDLSPTATLFTLLTFAGAAAAVQTTGTVYQLKSDVANAAVQVDVVAAAFTLTRASGSWITDGFAVDDWVSAVGFTNAGNNVTAARIVTLTATVMTLENRPSIALVNETGDGNEVVTKLVPGTFVCLALPAGPTTIFWDAGVSLSGYSRYQATPTGAFDPYTAGPILQAYRTESFNMVLPGNMGGAIIAGADKLTTRIENATLGPVNGETVLTYAEIVYYTDDTFTTELFRTEHTPTYDAASAVLEAASNTST